MLETNVWRLLQKYMKRDIFVTLLSKKVAAHNGYYIKGIRKTGSFNDVRFKDYLSNGFTIFLEISRSKPLTMFSYNSKSPLGLIVSYFNNLLRPQGRSLFGESSGSYKTLLDCEENIKQVAKALKSYFERSL